MKCAMWNVKCGMRKAGVSLITVLLFMLVATIAATATYKWITSEGRSSASRMLQREAYQSSVAGLVNARTWMTYHANDVGDLIHQFINGGNKPINISDRLRPLQRQGQSYQVWLMGVNTDSPTYKVKLVSYGEARGGTRHGVSAIFNVDGLYQVRVPRRTVEEASKISFEYNYFGGSTKTAGQFGAKSMLVNGNVDGANPIYAQTDIVVTGNVIMSGNSIGADGNVCIGKDLDGSNGVFGGNFYVGGNAKNFKFPPKSEAKQGYYKGVLGETITDGPFNLTGDVYIGGNLEQVSGSQEFQKSLTINGTWDVNLGGGAASVANDLCVGENGVVNVPYSANNTFTVAGNVWMPGNLNLWSGSLQEYGCTCDKKTYSYSYASWSWVLQSTESNVACGDNSTDWATYRIEYTNKTCAGTRLVASEDNSSTYSNIVLGKNSSSDIYIKSAYKSTDYKKNIYEPHIFTEYGESRGYPRNCKGVAPCSQPSWWSVNDKPEETPDIYPDMGDGSSDKFYIYYMPDGVDDVGFGTYYDDHWEKDVASYYINGTEATKATRFTDSYHTNDANHTVWVDRAKDEGNGQKYYRYLNHDETSILGSPYCKLAKDKNWRPACGVTPWFKSNGNLHNKDSWGEKDFSCADHVQSYCLTKLGTKNTGSGCDNTDYKIVDQLKTGKNSFTEYENNGCTVTTWDSDDFSKNLNDCYEYNDPVEHPDRAKENLYNGYQVVRVTDDGKAHDSKTPLVGKFIIIVSNKMAQQKLPPTAPGSFVFLLLEGGASGTIQPATDDGSDYSYFIYAEANVKEILFNNEVFNGTFYGQVAASTAQAGGCVKADIQGKYMKYNDPLIKSLEKANILCDKSVSVCGGINSDDDDDSDPGDSPVPGIPTYSFSTTVPEEYYISMSPQLGVTLETQVETQESEPSGEANVTPLAASFMILPRIIYLPSDPYGKLSDYYNVLPLNGSTLTKSDISIASAGDSPASCGNLTNDPLVSSGSFTEGTIYRCFAKANGYSEEDVSFWVVIGGPQRGTPFIYFVEASQEMSPTTSTPAEVHAHIPPHSNTITLNVNCPNIGGADGTEGGGWKYSIKNGGVKDGTTCTFEIAPNTTGSVNLLLFEVTTNNAPNGTLSFQLGSGTGYLPSSPYTASLFVASTATLSRAELSSSDLAEYCAAHSSDCPENYQTYWPECDISNGTIWVEPSVSSFGTMTPNNQWSISLGASSSVHLVNAAGSSVNSNCVVIIADESRDISGDDAGGTIEALHASIKARKKNFQVGFVGNVGANNEPTIKVHSETRDVDLTPNCVYKSNGGNPQYCSYSVFIGEEISFYLVDDDNDEMFNYWKCDGENCPTGNEPLASHEFDAITISGDYTYLAHFGESDNHCFFEEFKEGDGGVYGRTNREDLFACGDGAQYCINYCNDANNGCATVPTSQNTKWSLIRSKKTDLEYSSLYGHLSVKSSLNKGKSESERKGVVVMSTVNAGMNGTMKALVQVPRNSEYGNSSKYIRNSGIILRSNSDVSEFLMLNLFVNSSGYLVAQACKNGTTNCETKEFSSTASISSMVMLEAALDDNILEVTVFTSPYYGTQIGETKSFDVSNKSVKDRSHEYVGFSMADPNFKIHGIGWHSEDYNADCFDSYPTVKCSFAAKAEGGYIETGKDVVPWIGYSGWFSATDCTPKFYYYGTDACNGVSGEIRECLAGKYNFANGEGNEGPHGYREGSVDVKTAKAWLNCNATSNLAADWWTNATENEYAHCGYFWTGKYVPCANDAELMSGKAIAAGQSGDARFSNQPKNLRKAKLIVTVEGDNSGDLELWLESKNDGTGCWGGCDPFQSQAIVITGNSRTIDKVEDVFAGDSLGFNLEKVTGVVVKNNRSGEVKVTVKTECENSIKVEQCAVTYNEASNQWNLTVTVGGNGDNPRSRVTTTQIEAKKNTTDGETIFAYGNSNVECTNSGNGNDILCTYPDNAYATNPGVKYVFNAKIVGNGGASTDIKENCASKDIGQAEVSCAISSEEYVYGTTLLPKFTPTITCPKTSGCGFDILYRGESILDNPQKTPVNANGYRASKSDEAIDNEYTYVVHSTDGSFEDCSKKFKVVAPGAIKADCAFDPAVVAIGGKTKLVMSNIQNLTTTTEFKLSENGANVTQNIIAGQSGEIKLENVPSTANSYTYKVSYVNAKNQTTYVCNENPVLTVVDGLTCSLKDHTIALNGSTTFEAVGGGSCESSSLDGSPDGAGTPTDDNCKQYTITPTAPGTYTYTYTYSGNLGTDLRCPSTSNLTLTVNPPAPTFDCSADPVTIGSGNPSINLTNIQWCDNNCTVVLNKGNSTLSESGSTSGNNDYTINFTDNVTEAGTVDYTVTLTSDKPSEEKTCSVVYNAAPTCAEITWNITGSNGSLKGKSLSNGCAIITTNRICKDEVQIKFDDCQGKSGKWNGVDFAFDGSTPAYYRFAPNPVVQMTNVLNVPDCSKINEIYVSGCIDVSAATNAPSISNCPGTSTYTTYKPYAEVSLPITVSNCDVIGGCNYTISATGATTKQGNTYDNKISFTGDAEGMYTYALTISNTKGSASCSFKINYDSNAATIASIGIPYEGADKISFTNSKTCGVSTSSSSWNTWVTGNIAGYWGGTGGQISGSIIVDIPAGEWFKIDNCW